jgi:NTP pyrophosphatase (non-canonical NTP hydrolase)
LEAHNALDKNTIQKGEESMELDMERQSRPLNEQEEKRIRAGIGELLGECHGNAVRKLWWTPGPTFTEAMMLVVTELSEAVEEFREGHKMDEIYAVNPMGGNKPEGIPIEVADAIIRIFDVCGGFNIPIADAIMAKMRYNRTRPTRHGGKRL